MMTAFFVITLNTRDYPGQAVLRRHVWRDGSFVPDWTPLAVGQTVDQVRHFLPPDVKQIPLGPEEDPVIKEWYA